MIDYKARSSPAEEYIFLKKAYGSYAKKKYHKTGRKYTTVISLYRYGRWPMKGVRNSKDEHIKHTGSRHVTCRNVRSPYIGEALIPVTSSGGDVIVAVSATPIHILPGPIFSAMISPYFESFAPEKIITDPAQDILWHD